MKDIYEYQQKGLRDLLEEAAQEESNILIPDLQRSYVWQPHQVILLLDSIFKGWPFGSLLTWKYFTSEDIIKSSYGIPARGFYYRFSRTPDANKINSSFSTPPAAAHLKDGYTMILDGQQRLQSLILAFYKGARFQLLDYDWYLSLAPERVPSRRSKHFSTGILCLDLDAFIKEITNKKDDCDSISVVDCLAWTIADKNECSSRRSAGFPLPLLNDPQRHFLPLHLLWKGSKKSHDNDILSKLLQDDILRNHLPDASWYSDDSDGKRKIHLLAKFMSRLNKIGELRIHCLEVQKCSFISDEEDVAGRAEEQNRYDDAIVNIFTRLNTAGRALTNQEITYAWLKRGWRKPSETPPPDYLRADIMVDKIKEALSVLNMTISDDMAISLLSTIWCVNRNKGALLTQRDFLDGNIIRPMAEFLSQPGYSKMLVESAGDFGSAVSDILAGSYLYSFNAIQIAFMFHLIVRDYKEKLLSSIKTSTPEEESIREWAENAEKAFYDRWFFVSTISGKWATNSDFFASLVKRLSNVVANKDYPSTIDEYHEKIAHLSSELLDTVVLTAQEHIECRVYDRSLVSQYRSRLAAWQRVNVKRARFRDMTFGQKGNEELQVDHIIAHSAWEIYITEQIESGVLQVQDALDIFTADENNIDREFLRKPENAEAAKAHALKSAKEFINRLGNCSLLKWRYNGSKGRTNCGDFLANVYEAQKNASFLPEWASAMHMSEVFLHPFVDSEYKKSNFTPADFAKAIREREDVILLELKKFIAGESGYDVLY